MQVVMDTENIQIKGIGCDMVRIVRIAKLLTDDRFLHRVYTDYEKNYCKEKASETAAGIWAAKEAVSKALGTGFCGFTLKDIEVRHNTDGQPHIILYNKAKERAKLLHIRKIHVSISHEAEQALSFAIAE